MHRRLQSRSLTSTNVCMTRACVATHNHCLVYRHVAQGRLHSTVLAAGDTATVVSSVWYVVAAEDCWRLWTSCRRNCTIVTVFQVTQSFSNRGRCPCWNRSHRTDVLVVHSDRSAQLLLHVIKVGELGSRIGCCRSLLLLSLRNAQPGNVVLADGSVWNSMATTRHPSVHSNLHISRVLQKLSWAVRIFCVSFLHILAIDLPLTTIWGWTALFWLLFLRFFGDSKVWKCRCLCFCTFHIPFFN